MVATLSAKPINSAQPMLAAAIDTVLENGWTTGNQLASIGRISLCTIRRWRREGCGFDLDVVVRWLGGPIAREARMAFAFALTAHSDLSMSVMPTPEDLDGDGRITQHDARKAVVLAMVSLASLLAGIESAGTDRRITPDELSALQPTSATCISRIQSAMVALSRETLGACR